ncbi:MAG: NIPSNAP family protein [Acidobacteriota bacterium]|nr:NIPSNAP family protein [Blastocatellia bacterium]MDW8412800.1 NIPSNAP family protein [Acidobacteriota bacterium]
MILLTISYRLQAHCITEYDRIWSCEVLPLIREYGFNLLGIWRSVVGPAGEYLELWQFESMAEFEKRWQAFMQDERLLAAFKKTGPLVLDEQLKIFEPIHTDLLKTGSYEGR